MSDFVSCQLCGAVFNGMAVPPHACLNSLPQPPVSWPVTTTCPRCAALERELADARATPHGTARLWAVKYEQAAAELTALREQRCETCRYRIGSDTLPHCHMWSPTDPMAKDDPVLCRHIQFCGAWARREP
jgi:hypothetical protein